MVSDPRLVLALGVCACLRRFLSPEECGLLGLDTDMPLSLLKPGSEFDNSLGYLRIVDGGDQQYIRAISVQIVHDAINRPSPAPDTPPRPSAESPTPASAPPSA